MTRARPPLAARPISGMPASNATKITDTRSRCAALVRSAAPSRGMVLAISYEVLAGTVSSGVGLGSWPRWRLRSCPGSPGEAAGLGELVGNGVCYLAAERVPFRCGQV
jgi:hypothetical protein